MRKVGILDIWQVINEFKKSQALRPYRKKRYHRAVGPHGTKKSVRYLAALKIRLNFHPFHGGNPASHSSLLPPTGLRYYVYFTSSYQVTPYFPIQIPDNE